MITFISQFFSFVAWVMLIISFWKNKNDKILYLQVISCIFFSLNYILIGAWTGLFVVFFEIIRDFLYIRYEDDRKTFLFTIPIYFLIGIVWYDGLLSLFSVFAVLNDGYSLIYKGNKLAFLANFTYVLWFIYDMSFSNYVNVIAEVMIIISNIFILINGKKDSLIIGRS